VCDPEAERAQLKREEDRQNEKVTKKINLEFPMIYNPHNPNNLKFSQNDPQNPHHLYNLHKPAYSEFS
jgi:hypothetical protein